VTDLFVTVVTPLMFGRATDIAEVVIVAEPDLLFGPAGFECDAFEEDGDPASATATPTCEPTREYPTRAAPSPPDTAPSCSHCRTLKLYIRLRADPARVHATPFVCEPLDCCNPDPVTISS
jgi:hypothetical protein